MTEAQVAKHYSDAKYARYEKRYIADQRESRQASRAYNRAERRYSKEYLENYNQEPELVTDPISEAVQAELEHKQSEKEDERAWLEYLEESVRYHKEHYWKAIAALGKLLDNEVSL